MDNSISIHAPTRGATQSFFLFYMILAISIHAPTRGATCTCAWMPRSINFNPRSHERSDGKLQFLYMELFISIHAPTRGATKSWRTHSLKGVNFNPRSHERSDGNNYGVVTVTEISIHAPTRGATKRDSYGVLLCRFQSTLPREERLCSCAWMPWSKHFNPRSHERSDSQVNKI